MLPPTVGECYAWVTEHCNALLYTTVEEQDMQTVLDSTRILIQALDAPLDEKDVMHSSLDKLRHGLSREANDCVIQQLQSLLLTMKTRIRSHSTNAHYSIEQPRILPQRYTAKDYKAMGRDAANAQAHWFRLYFIGKPYMTLIGPLSMGQPQHCILSIVNEATHYRMIVRTQQFTHTHTVASTTVQLAEQRLAKHHWIHVQPIDTKKRPLKGSSGAGVQLHTQQTKSMKAAIVAMYPTLDLRLFKELSATTTALIGLEKELIQFDEMNTAQGYKFGVLTVKEQQTTEEEWFSNSGLSCACERFLGLLGTRVELKGYSGYAAGLDTKTGESGLVSYVSRWEHHPIMYHVGPLMPLRNDKQQIHRKRYIGNDIVCVVFMEGKHSAFDPNTVTSQFLHVFIVVSPEHQQDKEMWRVQVMANKTIEEFGPCLPSPPLFDQHELHHFLTLKLIQAENAALKSDKFALLHTKTRTVLLNALMDTGLHTTPATTPSARSSSSHSSRTSSTDTASTQPSTSQRNYYGLGAAERPKSAGAQQQTRGSGFRTLCTLEPPTPSSSRSNVLRDLKSLGRRRSSTQAMLTLSTDTPSAQDLPTSPSQSHLGPFLPSASYQTLLPVEPKYSKSSCHEGGIRSRAQHLMTSVMGRRTLRHSSAALHQVKEK